jgi:acyl carrier protein
VSQQHELEVYAVLLIKTGSIPKTSSGKIQRYGCRVGFLDKSLDVVGDWIENRQSKVDFQQLQAKAESLLEQLPTSGQQEPFSNENESDSLSRSLKAHPTEEVIQAWMVSHLAVYLEVQPDDIDIREPVAHYGLDSSVAISLTGELADWLGCQLEPTIFWEYPSIEALAQYLVAESQLSGAAFQVGVSGGV